MKNVDFYIQEILKPQLMAYGVSAEFTGKILKNIEMQINSILKHWNDIPFRKALFVTGLDQAFFYEPEADIDVKCFVVITIRNSMLETIQSEKHKKAGLSQALKSEHIKTITGSAVNYFSKIDLEELSKEAKVIETEDYYGDISQYYPVAWTALKQLGMCKGKSVTYQKIPCLFAQMLTEINTNKMTNQRAKCVVVDGFSEDFDDSLIQCLRDIDAGRIQIFIIDSFKFVSRNFEKLLKVMEFVLTRKAAFATSNFYIENGYIEKRKTILRAAHSEKDLKRNMSNLSGVGSRHRGALKATGKLLEQNFG